MVVRKEEYEEEYEEGEEELAKAEKTEEVGGVFGIVINRTPSKKNPFKNLINA